MDLESCISCINAENSRFGVVYDFHLPYETTPANCRFGLCMIFIYLMRQLQQMLLLISAVWIIYMEIWLR